MQRLQANVPAGAAPSRSRRSHVTPKALVTPLASGQEAEVLAFLSARPLHTVIMAGLIRDNGLVSPLNRGTFYGCRDEAGRLNGIAIIGHLTQIESDDETVVAAFAAYARACAHAYVILGEQAKVGRFWQHYAEDGRSPRLICRELMYTQQRTLAACAAAVALRPARLDELDAVMAAHAWLAHSESGHNPLETDPAGFGARARRRIEQGRVWVLVEHGELIFKADVVADTPQAVYLEGVFVSPAERGRGHGLRCLAQLGKLLLTRADTLCLLVNEENERAQSFYRRAGFELYGRYNTIFLRTQA